MLFLISILIACAFAWFCAKPLRSHPVPFYIGAAVLTVLMIVLGRAHITGMPAFVNTYVIGIFTHGALAAALWCMVAWMGALPNGTAAIKHLMPVRGELSIFAAIVTLSHAVTYGITYIQRLVSGGSATTDFVLTSIVSLLLMLIMIPLTVLSFKTIRKKVNAKKWKAIQRTAYAFYALIYLHVMVIFLPRARMGREGAMFSIIVYSLVFFGYAAMRIYKYIIVKKKPESRAALRSVCAACFALAACGMGFAARPVNAVRSAETTPHTTEAATEASAIAETTPAATAEATTEAAAETTTETTAATEDTTASDTSETEETTASTEETTETTTEATDAAATEAPTDAPAEAPAPVEEAPAAADPAPAADPVPEPAPAEPVYLYNNGTYHVDIFGYDADEHLDITIENDCIVSITGSCDESDPWYFDSALPAISGAIIAANSPDIPDAVSGATISSECIKQAVRNALAMARK